MDSAMSIAIAAFTIIAFATILILISGKKSSHSKSNLKQKNRATIIRESTKKLAHNPHNVQALKPLAELYYSEHLWDKALPLYDTLSNIASRHPEIEIGETNLKQGICLVKLGKAQEATQKLIIALKSNPTSYEANLFLGKSLFKLNNFEKAIPLLKKALSKTVYSCCEHISKHFCLYLSERSSISFIFAHGNSWHSLHLSTL